MANKNASLGFTEDSPTQCGESIPPTTRIDAHHPGDQSSPPAINLDFEFLLEAMGDAVSVIGRNFRTIWGNSAFFQLYGDVVGEHCYEACKRRETVCEVCAVQQVFERGEMVRVRSRSYDRKGQAFCSEVTATPLRDKRGRIVATVEVMRDITEHCRLEEALQASEVKYRIVADNTYDWEFWVSPEGRFLYSSPSCERITGYGASEFEANPDLVSNIVHPEDFTSYSAHRHDPEQGVASSELEFRIIRRDGRERWIGHVCQPVYDSDGTYLGSRGSNRDITERKRAEEEVLHRNKHLLALNAVAEAVNQELDLDSILSNTLDTILDTVGIEAGAIFLLDEAGEELSLRIHRGLSDEFVRQSGIIRVGERVSGQVAQTGEPMLMGNLSDDEVVVSQVVKKEGFDSYLSVPLKSKGVVVGVMAIGSRSWREFTLDQVQLFTAIGNQVGVAVQNAILFGGLSRRLQELSTLHEVSTAVAGKLILDEVLQLVMEKAAGLTDAEVTAISLLSSDGQTRVTVGAHGEGSERLQGVEVPAGEGMHGWVMETRQPAVVDDLGADSRSNVSTVIQLGLTSALIAPLEVKGEIIGCLSAYNKRGRRRFVGDDLGVLATFANQAAIAIEHARLFEELSNKRIELEENAGQLRLLLDRTFRAQEEERRRIATDIHDGIAQPILGALLQIQASGKHLNRDVERVRENLDAAKLLLNESLAEMKRAIFDLRPPTLEMGLLPAVQSFLSMVQRSFGITCFLRSSGHVRQLPPAVEIAVYRIIQEAMNNVGKHSSAAKAHVFVEYGPTSLRVIVRDDGSGFDLENAKDDSERHLGLISIRERAQSVNGRVYLETFPGYGTRLILEVSLEEHQANRA